LIGAKNVDVDGTFYDVIFEDGTFDDVFGSIPTWHDTESKANDFTQALLDHVFVDLSGPPHKFDAVPATTRYCTFGDTCVAYVPYQVLPFPNLTFVQAAGSLNHDDEAFDPPTGGTLTSAVAVEHEDGVFAVFSPSPIASAAPEPATYAMLTAGLLILAGLSRRSNRV